ncbi:MAG: tetratricopeptide repeat protein [Clostridium sp.]
MNDEYIFQVPFIKYQKVKGVFVVPLFLIGIGALFINIYIAVFIILCAIGLFLYYRNSSKNQSALYFNSGLKNYIEGKVGQAKEYLSQATVENRENSDAYLLLGAIYYDEKNYRKAITNLKNGNIDSLENENLQYVISDCYYNTEKYDKALKYIENIKCDNDQLENMRVYLLTKIFFNLGKYNDAHNSLKKFLIPDNFSEKERKELNYYYCITCIELGDINSGIKVLSDLLKEDRYYRNIEGYGKKLELI